jgi:hypothetical protein
MEPRFKKMMHIVVPTEVPCQAAALCEALAESLDIDAQ